MPSNKITLNNTYFSRFYFHYEIEFENVQENSFLEVSLDPILESAKRTISRFDFRSTGLKKITDKIALAGLGEQPLILAFCLFDASSKRVLASNSMPIEFVLERDPMIGLAYDYELLNLSVSEVTGLSCKMLIKNLGSLDWGEDSPSLNLNFRMEATGLSPIIVNTTKSISLRSGEIAEISIEKEEFLCKQGIYKFTPELVIGNTPIAFLGASVKELSAYLANSGSNESAKIALTSSSFLNGRFITIEGIVENTGFTDWYMGPEVFNPFLLGFNIYSVSGQGNVCIGEGRFRSDSYWCKSGEKFKFFLSHELKESVKGDVKIDLDMVRECAYWFKSRSDTSLEIVLDSNGTHLKKGSLLGDGINDSSTIFSYKPVKTILFIAPSLPLFDREAGGLRMLELLKLFIEEDSFVYFFYESAGISGDVSSYLSILADLGVKLIRDLRFLNADPDIKPDLVFVSTWNCIERYVDNLRYRYPEAVFVGDMIDLHWKREGRAIEQGLSNVSLDEWKNLKEREKKAYRSCDLTVVVTEEDRLSLLEEEPNIRTIVLSTIHRLREVAFKQESIDDPKALFVGHFRHVPNVSSCLEAIVIIKRYNELRGKKVILNIIGDNAPTEILRCHDGDVIFVRGYVPDLRAYEEMSTFLLAPITFGAGIKGKICEAISAGIPVLTNEIGNEGIGLEHKSEAFIAEDQHGFIEGIDFILEDYERSQGLVSASRDKIKKLFSRDAQKSVINNLISPKKITISIVTFNQAGLLEKCLNSIFNLTNYSNFDVFVYSNACTDNTPELLLSYKNSYEDKFNFYIAKENDYFVRPNNFVIKEVGDRDVVLLNNDVEIIDPYWLDELNFAAYMAPWIGAAGCMVLDSEGKISEAGARMNLDGIGANLGRGDSPNNPAHNQVKYVDYVSGCCLYMKRASIDLIGSLDEDFHPMYYEDTAWQFKLRNEGYKTVYTPRTRIIHKEGSSAGTDLNTGMKKFQAINREKFKKKFSSK
jgi:GT2 family glycosyltransferase/glycosyltransferase involved in cell wall biosynthesis